MANPVSPAIKTALPLVAIALIATSTGYALRSLTDHDGTAPPPANAPSTTGGTTGFWSSSRPGPPSPDAVTKQIAEALKKSGGAPTIDQVLATRGFNRYESLARFLVNASAADCETLYTILEDDDDLDHHCIDAILLRWAEVDPEGARKKNKYAGVWAWAKSDPDAALAFGLANDRASIALRAIGQTDGRRGLELLRQHPEAGGHSSWDGIVGGLAKVDRRAAVEFALQQGVDFDETMKAWTFQDPDGALKFALGLEDPRHRRKALNEFIPKLAESDPSRAAEIVASLPAGSMRRELVEILATELATTNPDTAIEMARTAPTAAERNAAFSEIVTAFAPSDPDRAIALIAESPDSIELITSTTSALARLRPTESLSAGIAPRSIAREWIRQEPEVASAWIAEQPLSEDRHEMVQGLVEGITIESPEPDFHSATAWALTLDENRQQESLQNVFRRWWQADQESAREAAADPEIPQSIRDELANPDPFQMRDPFGLG